MDNFLYTTIKMIELPDGVACRTHRKVWISQHIFQVFEQGYSDDMLHQLKSVWIQHVPPEYNEWYVRNLEWTKIAQCKKLKKLWIY